MTSSGDGSSRPNNTQEELIDRLAAALSTERLDEDVENDAPDERLISGLLQSIPGDAFDPSVVAAVDRMSQDSESVGIATRQRLTAAAERGIRWRARSKGPLQPLLRSERSENKLPLATVAETIGVPELQLRDVERGSRPINSLSGDQVAQWIRSVDLDRASALIALRRSLVPSSTRTVYAGQDPEVDKLTDEAEAFYQAVAQALGHE